MKLAVRHMLGFAVVTAAALACSSCAPTVTVTPLGAERSYPVTPDSVNIPLYSTAKPQCSYDEIAAITAEAMRPPGVVLSSLREKARALGAQAITGFTQTTRNDGTVVRSGTAIRFRSPECTS